MTPTVMPTETPTEAPPETTEKPSETPTEAPPETTEKPSVIPLAIPPEVRAWVYAHALATFPEECCGYLTGPRTGDRVDTAIACRNAQADGEHPIAPYRSADTGFVIAGAELLRFARAFDTDQPPRVVYHSHSNGRAYFSEIDRQMAAGPSYPVQHLVIGVVAGAITEVAQFAWSEADRDHVEVARWQP